MAVPVKQMCRSRTQHPDRPWARIDCTLKSGHKSRHQNRFHGILVLSWPNKARAKKEEV